MNVAFSKPGLCTTSLKGQCIECSTEILFGYGFLGCAALVFSFPLRRKEGGLTISTRRSRSIRPCCGVTKMPALWETSFIQPD